MWGRNLRTRLSSAGAWAVIGPTLFATTGARADDEGCRRAEPLVAAGAKQFQSGASAEAVAALNQALKLCQRPVLYYNLARAQEAEGNLEAAIRAYEEYLRGAPESEDRGGVERRIATMRRELELREETSPSPFPWILAGAGVVTIGAGLLLGSAARRAESDAERADSHAQGSEDLDRAEFLATTANLSFLVGGLLSATGLTWAFFDITTKSERSEQVAISIAPGGASLRLSLDFW